MIPQYFVLYLMPLFFVLSGIFYHPNISLSKLVKRRYYSLLQPLAFWLVVTWLFEVLKHKLLHSSGGATISWDFIYNIGAMFNVSNPYVWDMFLRNDPLWFLWVLFSVQILYHALQKWVERPVYLVTICLIVHVVGLILLHHQINGLLLISTSMKFLVYYALGSIVFRSLIDHISSKSLRCVVLSCATPIVLVATFFLPDSYAPHTMFVASVCFAAILLELFYWLRNWNFLARPLEFFGRNSLIVLVAHIPISIMIKFLLRPYLEQPLAYVLLFVAVCAVLYLLVLLCNRFIPFFVGKK